MAALALAQALALARAPGSFIDRPQAVGRWGVETGHAPLEADEEPGGEGTSALADSRPTPSPAWQRCGAANTEECVIIDAIADDTAAPAGGLR